MADPVKTQILRAIKNCIEAVDGVGMVVRNPSNPPQRETAIYPLVFVFDEAEAKVQRNRFAINILPIHVEVWFRADNENASDDMDILDAKIYQTLLTDPAVIGLVSDIRPSEEVSAEKQYPDDQLGVLILKYVVKYAHKWGDATDGAKV